MKKLSYAAVTLVVVVFSVSCINSSKNLTSDDMTNEFLLAPDMKLARKFSVARGYTVHKPGSAKPEDYPDTHFGFAADEETLRRWLAWCYPNLDRFMKNPAHPYFHKYQYSLKEIALNITFFIDYGPDIENIGGSSAEDDPHFYVYPNTEFFHAQLRPEGKIRVTVTKYFIRTLQLVEAIEKDQNVFLWATRQRTQGFFAHELLHAAQYAKAPLRNVANFAESIKDGIAPQWLYDDALKKVTVYEPEGLYMQHLFDKDLTVELDQFAKQVQAYKEKYPEQFSAGGKFEILGKHNYLGMNQQAKNIEFDLSVPGEVRAKKWKSASFIGIMDGYHVPLKVVRDLYDLDQRISRKKVDRPAIHKELAAITQPWFALFGSAELKNTDTSDPVVSTINARHPYHKQRGVFAKFDQLYRRVQARTLISNSL